MTNISFASGRPQGLPQLPIAVLQEVTNFLAGTYVTSSLVTTTPANTYSMIQFPNIQFADNPFGIEFDPNEETKVYVNGVLIEQGAVQFTQSGSVLQVRLDNTQVGYYVDGTDVVTLKGTFRDLV